jgi:HNH endonuclease
MSVNFSAVHDQKRWRKHRKHQSLQAAIDGKDGAKNLLRRIGRATDMWQKYGDVRCVFVWEDDAENGQAFRLAPNGGGIIQAEKVKVDRIVRFDRKKDCNAQEIAECFRAHALPEPEQQAAPTVHDAPTIPLDGESLYPDELPDDKPYIEGLAQQVLVNRYERSIEARKVCIGHYKCVCQVCRVDFSERYGLLGIGFIHVHHRVPIAIIGRDYRIDPIKDLVPVCPNCHAMLHRREPPLEIEQLRGVLNDG